MFQYCFFCWNSFPLCNTIKHIKIHFEHFHSYFIFAFVFDRSCCNGIFWLKRLWWVQNENEKKLYHQTVYPNKYFLQTSAWFLDGVCFWLSQLFSLFHFYYSGFSSVFNYKSSISWYISKLSSKYVSFFTVNNFYFQSSNNEFTFYIKNNRIFANKNVILFIGNLCIFFNNMSWLWNLHIFEDKNMEEKDKKCFEW